MINKVLIAALGVLCLAVAVQATEESDAANPEATHAEPSDILPDEKVASAIGKSAESSKNDPNVVKQGCVGNIVKGIGSTIGRKGRNALDDSKEALKQIKYGLQRLAVDRNDESFYLR